MQSFHEGRLTGPPRYAIVDHIADCEGCRLVVVALAHRATAMPPPGPAPSSRADQRSSGSGCPTDEEILAFVTGRLHPESLPAFREHLQGCAGCMELFQALSNTAPGGSRSIERPSSREALRPGQRIGSYRITGLIGQGGMGAVFGAVHEQIGKRVAIKVLDPSHAHEPDRVTRFLNEARAASRVEHPGIVHIFEFGETEGGPPYLVMEYLDGQSLQQALDAGSGVMEPARALRLCRQIAAALCAAHARDIVHRDLKPSNVMLVSDPDVPGGERAKVLDFGLAKLLDPDTPLHLTSSGVLVGTPLYMSPEQCREARRAGDRSDVYSLGVVLYQALCGQPPFQGPKLGAMLEQHQHKAPPPLREHTVGLPGPLIDLVHQMLAKAPEQRPAMAEVVTRLDALAPLIPARAGGSRATRRVMPRIIFLTTAIAVLTAASVAFVRLRRPAAMAYIPGGTFEMGSSASVIDSASSWCERVAKIDGDPCDRAVFEREQPTRTVRISPFYLDTTEVTFSLFARWLNRLSGLRVEVQGTEPWVMLGPTRLANIYPTYYPSYGLVEKQGRFSALAEFADQPVTKVTWDGARLYCQAQGKRLPTEAEWEFAARGPEGFAFPWGNDEPRCDGVAYGRRKGEGCEHMPIHLPPVGTSQQDRTPLGVYDLGGSAGEWVMDRFEERYRPCPQPCVDPVVEDGAGPLLRVIRGGTFSLPANMLRSAGRYRRAQNDTMAELGFRCAKSAR